MAVGVSGAGLPLGGPARPQPRPFGSAVLVRAVLCTLGEHSCEHPLSFAVCRGRNTGVRIQPHCIAQTPLFPSGRLVRSGVAALPVVFSFFEARHTLPDGAGGSVNLGTMKLAAAAYAREEDPGPDCGTAGTAQAHDSACSSAQRACVSVRGSQPRGVQTLLPPLPCALTSACENLTISELCKYVNFLFRWMHFRLFTALLSFIQ